MYWRETCKFDQQWLQFSFSSTCSVRSGTAFAVSHTDRSYRGGGTRWGRCRQASELLTHVVLLLQLRSKFTGSVGGKRKSKALTIGSPIRDQYIAPPLGIWGTSMSSHRVADIGYVPPHADCRPQDVAGLDRRVHHMPELDRPDSRDLCAPSATRSNGLRKTQRPSRV